jgi:hypothetical protein
MNQNSDPLDYLIEVCQTAVNTGKWNLTNFTVLNAKDELNRLRKLNKELANEAAKANQWAIEESNKNLNFTNVAWVRINSHGDLYDPRLCLNPYLDENTVLPLYSNRKEFQEKYGKLSQ